MAGNRAEATAAVPDEYLDLSMLCGDETTVRQRLAIYKELGITHLNVTPTGDQPLDTIEMVKAWIE